MKQAIQHKMSFSTRESVTEIEDHSSKSKPVDMNFFNVGVHTVLMMAVEIIRTSNLPLSLGILTAEYIPVQYKREEEKTKR